IADFIVAVAKPAARDTDAEVRVRAESVGDAEFGIEVGGRDGQAQREVRLKKIRRVAQIKRVGGDGRMALEGSVVTELDQFARNRIHLRKRDARAEAARIQQDIDQPASPAMHAPFLTKTFDSGKWFDYPNELGWP